MAVTVDEFLNARLNEREADLDGEMCDCPEGETPLCCIRQAQADIKAMRAIAEACRDHECYCIASGVSANAGGCVLDRAVLHLLATAFSWHPDFDPGWSA